MSLSVRKKNVPTEIKITWVETEGKKNQLSLREESSGLRPQLSLGKVQQAMATKAQDHLGGCSACRGPTWIALFSQGTANSLLGALPTKNGCQSHLPIYGARARMERKGFLREMDRQSVSDKWTIRREFFSVKIWVHFSGRHHMSINTILSISFAHLPHRG